MIAFEVVIPLAAFVHAAFGVLAGEVLETYLDAELSANEETFVNVEVDTGECVYSEEVVGAGVVQAGLYQHVVKFSLACLASGNEFEAETCACIEVHALVGQECALVAEVDREVAFTVLCPDVRSVVGIVGGFVGVNAETDAEADGIFVGEEVASFDLVNLECLEVVGEGVELKFYAEFAFFGSVLILCNSGSCDGCNEGSADQKLFLCCVLIKIVVKLYSYLLKIRGCQMLG